VFLAVAAYQQSRGLRYPLISASPRRAGCAAHGEILDRPGMLLWAGSAIRSVVALGRTGRGGKVGFDMLNHLSLRRRGVTVISCPSCARQQFRSSAVEVLETPRPNTTPLTLSSSAASSTARARRANRFGFTGAARHDQVYISGIATTDFKDADNVDTWSSWSKRKPRNRGGKAEEEAAARPAQSRGVSRAGVPPAPDPRVQSSKAKALRLSGGRAERSAAG